MDATKVVIKKLTKEEKKIYIEDIISLWDECFHDTKRYMDYYTKWKIPTNEVLVAIYEKKVISMIHLNPYRIRVNEEINDLYYIVGVATKEEYRKHGLMRRLLEKAFSFMREKKCKFTYLMPANKKIYEPFGFEYIYTQNRMEIIFKANGKTKVKEPDILIKRLDNDNLIVGSENLVTFTNKMLLKKFKIYAVRDANYYNELLDEMNSLDGNILMYYNENEIIGYMSYIISNNIVEVVESIIVERMTDKILKNFISYINEIYGEKKIIFQETEFMDVNIIDKEFCENVELNKESKYIEGNCDNNLDYYIEGKMQNIHQCIMAKGICTMKIKMEQVYLNEIV